MRRHCSIWFDLHYGKDNVSFNLTRNERHFYDSQQSIERPTSVEDEIDREFELALESGKVSQSEMMKELLELCGWDNEEREVFPMPRSPPSDSGGSFTYDFCTTSVDVTTTDDSEPSTPTRTSRIRNRQASVSSLKFDSLRLNTSPYSRPKKFSRLPSNSTHLSKNQSAWWNDITQGIMREDVFTDAPVQQERPSESQTTEEESQDFWNDVEF